jgi:membrane protease YdiL (CAAX protease family)
MSYRPSGGSRTEKVPWTLGQTVLGTLLTLVPLLAILIGSQLVGSGGTTPTKPLPRSADMTAAILVIATTIIVEGALLIAPLFIAVLRPAPGYSPLDGLRALGFRGVSLGSLIGWLIGGMAIALAANYAYSVVIQRYHLPFQTNGDLLLKEAKYAPLTVLATVAGAALIAPICEETFFRGFLQGGLQRSLGGIIAVFFSSLVFGIAHADIGSFALLFVLGLVLGVARLTSGSLWPGFLIHTANNSLAALAVLPIILPALQH